MKFLIVSPTPTHPQSAGNRARIHALMTELKASGHWVGLVFLRMEHGDEEAMVKAWDLFVAVPYTRPRPRFLKRCFDTMKSCFAIQQATPYQIDEWYDETLSGVLKDLQSDIRPDVVVVEYVFMSKAFSCFDSASLKILDTHDIFGDRHKLYQDNGMVPRFFYSTVAEEKRALDRADVILAIQQEDAAYFSRLTVKEVCCVGHLVPLPPIAKDELDKADQLLFVGSENPINVNALNWFIADVLPLVCSRLPNIKLEVVGGSAEYVHVADNVILTGRVADLAPCYKRSRVVVNPVRFGTGLKIKSIEALAYGRPLVTTRAGAVGMMEGDNKAFIVADEPEDFADAIYRVVTSSVLAMSLAEAGRRFAEDYNGSAVRPFMNLLMTKREGGQRECSR